VGRTIRDRLVRLRGMPNDPALKKSIKGVMLGYTRKRNLFLPEWADDKSFWNERSELHPHG